MDGGEARNLFPEEMETRGLMSISGELLKGEIDDGEAVRLIYHLY